MLTEKMHWLDLADRLEDEARQMRAEGRDPTPYLAKIGEVRAVPDRDQRQVAAQALLLEMSLAPISPDYPYSEPESYSDTRQTLPAQAVETLPSPPRRELSERIRGAWCGRAVGCLLGIPVEGWTRQHILDLLADTQNLPMTRYISSAIPDEIRRRHAVENADPGTSYDRQNRCWINNITRFPVDDDTNYTVLSLKVLERFGPGFTSMDVAETWLYSIPALHACTAERVAYRNLLDGHMPPRSALLFNPYREWVGAQIRADFYGYIAPGRPMLAAEMAFRDASVSHTRGGVYSAMLVAAILSIAIAAGPSLAMPEIVERALYQIPPKSRLHEAVHTLLGQYRGGTRYDDILADIHMRYDETSMFDWCDTIPNALLVAACLLYHSGSYDEAVTQAVCAGFDTDCNGATVGSIMGGWLGRGAVGPHWLEGLEPVVETSVHGYSLLSLEELAMRTLNVTEQVLSL